MLEHWNITGRLHKVDVPTLVIRGEFDSMTEVCSNEIVKNVRKAWPLVTIPRSGHLKMIDEANLFIEAVNKFLVTVEDKK